MKITLKPAAVVLVALASFASTSQYHFNHNPERAVTMHEPSAQEWSHLRDASALTHLEHPLGHKRA